MSTIMNGDGNYAYALLMNFYFKRFIEVRHLVKGIKNLVESQVDLI